MRQRRIQVPLSPETDKALQEYAEVTGLSMAATCAQLLDQAAPGLKELSAAMRKANEHPAAGIRQMARALEKATQDANQIAMDLKGKKPKKAK